MHHGSVSPEIAAGLLALRKRIAAAKIPPSQLDESINIAVWNIREFGRVRRTEAAIHYTGIGSGGIGGTGGDRGQGGIGVRLRIMTLSVRKNRYPCQVS